MTVLVIGAMLLLSAAGGWPLVAGILHLAARSADSGGQDVPGNEVEAPDQAGSLRGGTWIGVLERLAVTATLAAGFPEGIAIVVAIKGLGRFSELAKNPAASERFVIGTLASTLWAGVVGAVARVYLG